MNRPLTQQLMELVLLLQCKRIVHNLECSLYEASGLPRDRDLPKHVERYYVELPDKIVEGAGLVKNRACFDALMFFTVTDEMKSTTYADLPKKFVFPEP